MEGRERGRRLEREKDLLLYERSEFKLLFHLPIPSSYRLLGWSSLGWAKFSFLLINPNTLRYRAIEKGSERRVAVANGI